MDPAHELANYQFKLNQVEETLLTKPDDPELISLKTKLSELIVLYTDLVAASNVTATSNEAKKAHKKVESELAWQRSKAPVFTVGQQILAKYSGDGNFYKCTVISAPQNPATHPYSITFHGYGNTEQVFAEDLSEDLEAELVEANKKAGVFDTFVPTANKRKTTTDEHVAASIDSKDPVKPKPKKKKLKDVISKKEQEQLEKQNNWKSFAASGGKVAKKNKATAMLTKHRSIFATPDDPNAKVGVIGSGRPMSERSSYAFKHPARGSSYSQNNDEDD
ncbi:hypothetical protein HK098_001692 [Nowakowskiella sp. JEL0407]|nr:hypothetical protein HK098_001692 [Nowakowskiella sp. JEL0407]